MAMTSECIMCGRPAANGILCEKCDRPKGTPKTETSGSTVIQPQSDPFPEARVVKFPVETTSVAMTDIREILAVSRIPSLLIGPDRKPRYVSEEARTLLGIEPGATVSDLGAIEKKLGFTIPGPKDTQTSTVEIGSQAVIISVVPLSGSASGYAVIFKPKASGAPDAYMGFVRETILKPLLGLREALLAAAERTNEPVLNDSASTIEQVLSSLELAPELEENETSEPAGSEPSVGSVARNLSERFGPLTKVKKIQLQFDFPEDGVSFRDVNDLEEALGILVENSLHYVPDSGQIVVGLRQMEHKGKPLLLFFVMDNGPIVPQGLRDSIFEKDFVWKPSAKERTGRGLARCREFALAHGGSVWSESKTGKACTFFLRVFPGS